MKKLFSLAALAVMFVACGSDAPDIVVKKHINAFMVGDGKEAAKYVHFESEDEKKEFIKDLTENAGDIKRSIAKQGIELVNTFVINESETQANVSVVMKKYGRTDDSEVGLTKINGTWYMDYPFK
ncbi:DUF4878 domain-containing protein [Campylobacter sp. RM12654]|uniref:hypothetical protein n=1 Tax=unclassified Campylobacter TaxID=2593542 RepID=UPI001D70B14E|nr:DUF4878 domain-containing protein [Campylobacter sp. RM12654]MBZ7983895.1 DUF4878 domain-containing protein [Campylobacter sp. RM12647]